MQTALKVAPEPALLTMAGGIQAPRSQTSFWTAIVFHAVAIALIAFLIARHVSVAAPVPKQIATIVAPITPPPPPPVMPRVEKMGGGGGQHDLAPVTKGHLPKFSQEPQIVQPKAPPTSVMEKEAAAVGRFHSEATGRSYARLQIITLAELFAGKKPDIPFVDPYAAFRRAPREDGGDQANLL